MLVRLSLCPALQPWLIPALILPNPLSSGGVLGLSFLRQVELEIDLDRDDGTLVFHPLGHVDQGVIDLRGMTRLEMGVMKGGLMVVPASVNRSPLMPAIVDIRCLGGSWQLIFPPS